MKNTLDKYVYLYERLHNRAGINPFLFSPLRRIIRILANTFIPKYFKNSSLSLSEKQSDVIVSLTSFPARISNVHLVIQCLLRQTVLPRKVILWLSEEQFRGVVLPSTLTSLTNEIFNIRFVDGDIRSHKKYYYAISEFPDSDILLVDDDLYYPTDMIEKMLNASKEYPETVICRFGSIMKYKSDNVLPYNDWWDEVTCESGNQNLFFGSGGGTLIKKKWFYEDILNIKLARTLTPLADDVWLNAMVNLKGTKKYKVKCGLILPIIIKNNEKLSYENVVGNRNSEQIEAVMNYYRTQLGVVPFKEM